MNAKRNTMHRFSLLLISMTILLTACVEKLSTSHYSANDVSAGGEAGDLAPQHGSQSEAAKSGGIGAGRNNAAAPSSGYMLSPAKEKPSTAESKIIKTARLGFQVESLEKSKKHIIQLVDAEKGYIANLEETNDRTRIQASFVIRVPAANFDRLVENILKEGKYVSNSKIERRDVTEEFVDLKARMETKKAEEARCREILHQARSVEDILKVENALGSLREDIESKEGRMNYLAHQAEYSTISALVYQTLPFTRPPQSEGFFSRLWASLANGWTGLVDFLIGILAIWPLLIIFAILAYFISRRVRRKKQVKG
jgi:hypothetical protein